MAAQRQAVDLDFGSDSRGTNHLDPASPQDVATKNYVDTHPAVDQNAAWVAYFIS